MDPNANIKEQIELALKMTDDYENENGNGIDQDDAERLAELVLALHGWLRGGGFPPTVWAEQQIVPTVRESSDACNPRELQFIPTVRP